MIATILIEYRWLAPILLLLALTVGPLGGRWLVDHRRMATTLTIVSFLFVAVLTLAPNGRSARIGCEVQWMLPTWGRVELVANVVLFAVAVMFLGVAIGRPLIAFAAGSAVSATIETSQGLVVWLGRSCDTTDWLSNTIGSGVGALLASLALCLAGYARRKSHQSRRQVHAWRVISSAM